MRILSGVLVVLLLAGCSTPRIKFKELYGAMPIYGKFRREPSGMVLLGVGPSVRDHALIRLNDMKPMFNTAKADCVSPAIGSRQTVASECQEQFEVYRQKVISGGDAAMTGFVNVVTLGGLAGPGGNPVGVGKYSYTVRFDQEAYASDVNRLMKNVNPDHVIALFETKNFDYQAMLTKYRGGLQTIEKTVKVVDKSGFYTANDIDFAKEIRTELSQLPPIPDVTVQESDDIESLVRKKLNDFTSEVTSNSKYTVTCGSEQKNGYHFKLECPKSVTFDAGGTRLDSTVMIDSKDFSDVFPKFEVKDETLSGFFDGEKLEITNSGEVYISIDNLTLYYDNEIYTIKDMNLQLPPRSKKVVADIYRFSGLRQKANFPNITKEIARTKSVNFGLAIMYRLIDRNKEKTFYATQKFPLLDLLLGK